MSDAHPKSPEAELMSCWQSTMNESPDPGPLARSIKAHVASFDRKIFWRNFAEYAGCFALLVWNGYDLLKGNRLAAVSIAAVLFVMTYLWWKHRGLKELDPAMDAGSYKTALLKRFDDQIRLLSHVKYWYLGPLYVIVLVGAAKTWTRSRVAALLGMAIVLAAFAFVGWLNEVFAVRKLKETRAHFENLFSGQ
jgi:hypothetical protein